MSDEKCELEHSKLEGFVERRLATCKGDIAGELRKMNATLTGFSKAFPHTPDGEPDFGGHRKYHDKLIAAAEAEEAFWTGLRREVIKKGLFWGIVVVCGLVVLGIQAKFLGLIGK